MPQVKVYVKTTCPYCHAAVELLEQKKISYEVIDLTSKPQELNQLKAQTGHPTVPQIFIDDQMIGGYDQLVQLERSGKLEELTP